MIKTKNQNDPAEGITLERWKIYFESSGTNTKENDPIPNSYNQNSLKIIPSPNNLLHEILNQPFQKQDIDMILKKLKKGKSVRIDNLRNEVIKRCTENSSAFSDIIQFLGNELLKFEKYPKLWKTDLIRPIHKKESRSKESNYRGITLSSCVGKSFNAMVLNSISKAFEELDMHLKNWTFSSKLNGFQNKYENFNNNLILKTLMDKQFKNNQNLYCCFVDFSKAFDTVWRKGLLSNLRSYGIEGKMLNVLHSLYTDTTAHVKINNHMSEAFDILLGVKQGDPQVHSF